MKYSKLCNLGDVYLGKCATVKFCGGEGKITGVAPGQASTDVATMENLQDLS